MRTFIAVLLCITSSAHAGFYKCTVNGVVSFSDRPCAVVASPPAATNKNSIPKATVPETATNHSREAATSTNRNSDVSTLTAREKQREIEQLKQKIRQDPESEDLHQQLVITLLAEDQFSQAEAYLPKLQSINPNNSTLIKAQKYIQDYRATNSDSDKAMLKLGFSMSLLETVIGDLQQGMGACITKGIESKECKQENDNKLTAFTDKYRWSAIKDKQYRQRDVNTIMRELEYQSLFSKLVNANSSSTDQEASTLQMMWKKEIPNSPHPYIEYINFLIEKKQFQQAADQLEVGLIKYPQELDLLIFNAYLPNIVATNSASKRDDLLMTMNMERLQKLKLIVP